MFCPKCGAQNIEDAKFCRGCGADIGLVSQALTGQLPEKRTVGDKVADKIDRAARREARRHNRKNPPRLDKAISTGFTGLAFLVISIILAFTPMGRFWWYWMLIPAFTMIGGGLAEYARYKQSMSEEVELPGSPKKPAIQAPLPPARVSALPPRNTAELVPPPSVTEGTTRHLDMKAEAPTRHIGTPVEKPANDS